MAMPTARSPQPRAEAHGARWHLRAATEDLHALADQLAGGLDLADAAQYGRLLRAHARAVPAVEAACEAAGLADFLPDWPQRRRAPALLQDLAALGLAPPPRLRLSLHTAAEALGAAYVLEGSRLGNGLLLRRLGDQPAAYLGHQPPPGGWPGFLAQLEQALAEPALWPAAAGGARRAFQIFIEALRGEPAQDSRAA